MNEKRQVALVGATGFEPAASRSRTVRATKLRYAPNREDYTCPYCRSQMFPPVSVKEFPVDVAVRFATGSLIVVLMVDFRLPEHARRL